MKYGTLILHNGNEFDKYTGALSIPIYNASTYHQHDIEDTSKYMYIRSGNPTREALENMMAKLESGTAGFAFASGMAAISTCLASFLEQGDHLIATQDIYGGTYRILNQYFNKFGINSTFVDMTDPANIEKAITSKTKVLFLETPSNPLLKITDLKECVKIAKKHKIITMIDNTFLSPYFQRPLELGVDISIHSATKFLGGHSDVLGGVAVVNNPEHKEKLCAGQNAFGSVMAPQDCFLVMRGIKTLKVRMEAQQKSAEIIADKLSKNNWIKEVFYPGLQDHPGNKINRGQSSGAGCVVSVKTDTEERAVKIMKNVKLWSVAVSLGGVESILSYPSKMSHAAIPKNEREKLGITNNLIRLSVGLEEPEDLLEDIENSK